MTLASNNFDFLCEELYDPLKTGVVVAKTGFDEAGIAGIKNELAANQRNFVPRPYRYGTTVQGLSSWDFERAVMDNYTYLARLNALYEAMSLELHNRMGSAFYFDDVKVNASYYPAGSVGIGPHRDNTFSVNFIAIFVISGCNAFFTAREKDTKNEMAYAVASGDCILMRGPRSVKEKHLRPIHYVKQIESDRYIVTFREVNRGLLERTKNIYNL